MSTSEHTFIVHKCASEVYLGWVCGGMSIKIWLYKQHSVWFYRFIVQAVFPGLFLKVLHVRLSHLSQVSHPPGAPAAAEMGDTTQSPAGGPIQLDKHSLSPSDQPVSSDTYSVIYVCSRLTTVFLREHTKECEWMWAWEFETTLIFKEHFIVPQTLTQPYCEGCFIMTCCRVYESVCERDFPSKIRSSFTTLIPLFFSSDCEVIKTVSRQNFFFVF